MFIFFYNSTYSIDKIENYLYPDKFVYIEANSLKQVIDTSFSFFKSLRRDAQKDQILSEWRILTSEFKNILGLSLYEKDLNAIGIDTKQPVTATLNIINNNILQTSIYIPCKSSLNTYQKIKQQYLNKNLTQQQKELMLTIDVRELKKNELLKIIKQGSITHISHFKNYIVLSVGGEIPVYTADVRSSLSYSHFYQVAMKEPFNNIRFIINPSKISLLQKFHIFSKIIPNFNQIDSISMNILSIIGIVDIKANEFVFNIKTFFNDDFFKNKVLAFPINIQENVLLENHTWNNLRVDFLKNDPIIYLRSFLDAESILNFSKSLVPNINLKQKLFDAEGDSSLNNEIKRLFTNNIGIHVETMPSGFNFLNFYDWKPTISIETLKEKEEIQTFIEKFVHVLQKHGSENSINKISDTYWEIKYFDKANNFYNTDAKISKSIFLNFIQNELLVSFYNLGDVSQKEIYENIIEENKNLSKKYINKPLMNNMNMIFFIDLQKIYQKISTNKIVLLLGPTIIYAKYLNMLSIYSQYDNKSYNTEIKLKLK